VDVFGGSALKGNPVAVVVDAEGLSDATMRDFARWTNLSETTFLLPPTSPEADYRLRIFTPSRELPFAGHPTLGSAHAWLTDNNPSQDGVVVQECGIGLVTVRREGERLAFAAPEPLREGPLDDATLAQVAASLGIEQRRILNHQWVDNGPGWLAVLLGSAEEVLGLRPDFAVMRGLKVGVVAPYPAGSECAFEVRAFVPDLGVPEDPVTGSLNAGLARWLVSAGLAPSRYVASQGTALRRAGRVYVERDADVFWIGGATVTVVEGDVRI
jgi:PhzF family phenazine biosynthesis protein